MKYLLFLTIIFTTLQSYSQTNADRVVDSILWAKDCKYHHSIISAIPIKSPILKDVITIPPTFPYSGFTQISSSYGQRIHPIRQTFHHHSGIDIPLIKNDSNIYAPANGIVDTIGYNKLLGLFLVLKHKYHYSSIYGHLDSISVRPKDLVQVGSIIAKMGNTGSSTGTHLHFSVKYKNQTINPLPYCHILINKLKQQEGGSNNQ